MGEGVVASCTNKDRRTRAHNDMKRSNSRKPLGLWFVSETIPLDRTFRTIWIPRYAVIAGRRKQAS